MCLPAADANLERTRRTHPCHLPPFTCRRSPCDPARMSSSGLSTPPRVAVVGGGVTGLAAAHRLVERLPAIRLTLFEASGRLGGVLETIRRDGYLIEGGADNWITNIPWANSLCRRIGFEDQLVETNPAHRQAFVIHRGRLCKIPPGFVVMAPTRIWPVLTTPILSPWGKLRLAFEPWVRPPATRDDDESLASFVKRRLGREAYERLVQPLIGGIYTGDPEKLSLQSTMARFAEMERTDGSLVRAMVRQARENRARGDSGARYSLFVAPRDGMSSFLDALAARLPTGSIRLNTVVTRLARVEQRWNVGIAPGEPAGEPFDAVILAGPANATSRLLRPLAPSLADDLEAVPHASCSIVSLGYRRDQIAHRLDGFGFVVPMIERLRILSASFSSLKYAGRAPEGQVLIRVFIGGACQAELADLPDDQLVQIATADLARLLGISGDPQLVQITRRASAMPQYHVGHPQRVARIEAALDQLANLQLAGNALHGVGIPQCIHSGEQAADRVLESLAAIE